MAYHCHKKVKCAQFCLLSLTRNVADHNCTYSPEIPCCLCGCLSYWLLSHLRGPLEGQSDYTIKDIY